MFKVSQPMQDPTIVCLTNVSKRYGSGQNSLTVLDSVSLSISKGTSCAFVGPSGSGKTTLLGLCAGLDRASSGSIRVCGHNLEDLSEDGLAVLRAKRVGFVFQSFQLLPTLTALENVMVPAELNGSKNAKEYALELLSQVGLAERVSHYPLELSGGEQQRVAIARAYINHPEIMFADEPTGNLDEESGSQIADLLFGLQSKYGTTLVMATHNMELAAKNHRVLRIRAGSIETDSTAASRNEAV